MILLLKIAFITIVVLGILYLIIGERGRDHVKQIIGAIWVLFLGYVAVIATLNNPAVVLWILGGAVLLAFLILASGEL